MSKQRQVKRRKRKTGYQKDVRKSEFKYEFTSFAKLNAWASQQ